MRNFGWRHALEIVGLLILGVLFPVGVWITRSGPSEMGLLPDGAESNGLHEVKSGATNTVAIGIGVAVRSRISGSSWEDLRWLSEPSAP